MLFQPVASSPRSAPWPARVHGPACSPSFCSGRPAQGAPGASCFAGRWAPLLCALHVVTWCITRDFSCLSSRLCTPGLRDLISSAPLPQLVEGPASGRGSETVHGVGGGRQGRSSGPSFFPGLATVCYSYLSQRISGSRKTRGRPPSPFISEVHAFSSNATGGLQAQVHPPVCVCGSFPAIDGGAPSAALESDCSAKLSRGGGRSVSPSPHRQARRCDTALFSTCHHTRRATRVTYTGEVLKFWFLFFGWNGTNSFKIFPEIRMSNRYKNSW